MLPRMTTLLNLAAVESALDQLVSAPQAEREVAQETFVRFYRDAFRVSGGIWGWNLFEPLSAHHRALLARGDEVRAAALYSVICRLHRAPPTTPLRRGQRPPPG
jgi:hypothetical protein